MKRIVVIHTADWHLGKNRKHKDYLEQQRLMLSAILALVKDEIVSAEAHDKINEAETEVWLEVAGDIFDRNEDTDRNEFVLAIISMLAPLLELERAYPRFKMDWIDGNHDRQPIDPTDPNALVSVLSPLTKMVQRECIAVRDPIFMEERSLLLLPFGHYSEDEFIDLLSECKAQFVVAHECLYGITTDTGWKPPRDQDKYINIEKVLEACPHLTAIFMGDIHRSQRLDAEGKCWYSGSPITLDFGEKMPKGVLIHSFLLDGESWQRESEPRLQSLLDYEPSLKFHAQLGIIEDERKIPMGLLASYPDRYFRLVVTPEVHDAISRQLPHFFDSPQVTWDYRKEEITTKAEPDSSAEDHIDYYRSLIEQWLKENGSELTREEAVDVMERILKDFSERGVLGVATTN